MSVTDCSSLCVRTSASKTVVGLEILRGAVGVVRLSVFLWTGDDVVRSLVSSSPQLKQPQ